MTTLHVTERERDLLLVTQALFEPRKHAIVVPLVREANGLPPAIGRSAMLALQDTLAKGVARTLAREAARAGVALAPRAPALRFSAASFQLLRWLLAERLASPSVPRLPDAKTPWTAADQVLAGLVVDLAREAGVARHVLSQPSVQRAPLVALYAIDDVAAVWPAVPDGTALATGELADVVALLRAPLARRWRDVELGKRAIAEPTRRLAIGRAQGQVLEGLVRTAIAGGRLDVAAFLLDGMDAALRAGTPWGVGLDPLAPLGARAQARRAEVAPLRAVGAIAAERARLRLVGFVDDDYEVARARLRELEPFETVFSRAEAVVRDADDLEEPS